MKERPILFSTPMVQAIIAGRKTQTRRIVKPQPSKQWAVDKWAKDGPGSVDASDLTAADMEMDSLFSNPKYGKGDVLWVRETWTKGCEWDGEGRLPPLRYYFRASEDWTKLEWWHSIMRLAQLIPHSEDWTKLEWWHEETDTITCSPKWKPSIHMPKAAARIYLQVADVRIERLQDISEEDAAAEGVESEFDTYRDYHFKDSLGSFVLDTPKSSFTTLWESINGLDSWNQNPFVWVVSFRILSTTGRPENLEELCQAK